VAKEKKLIGEIHADEEMKEVFNELFKMASEIDLRLQRLESKISGPGVYYANLEAVLRVDNLKRLISMVRDAWETIHRVAEALESLDYYASVEETFSLREVNKEVRRALWGLGEPEHR